MITEPKPKPSRKREPSLRGITQVNVSGYKSISQEQSIDIKPLTLLAGTNSSGKSSIMQPLLLLKQTIEAPFDPGPLLLNGPTIKFTSTSQLFARTSKRNGFDTMSVGITLSDSSGIKIEFFKPKEKSIEIAKMTLSSTENNFEISRNMEQDDIAATISPEFKSNFEKIIATTNQELAYSISRNRCFLEIEAKAKINGEQLTLFGNRPGTIFTPYLRQIIHIPGLRATPEREYPVTAVGATFPGTFDYYVASVIAAWQEGNQYGILEQLNNNLARLGLTRKIIAKLINDAQITLEVDRLPATSNAKASDMVSIADVGFGVSQTLPVLVALLVAKPGQLVYLEQPEIHLHPRAQTILAEILVEAAKRGVRVVVETHSDLLLLGIQTLVAEGEIPPDDVILHWFNRDKNGVTRITSTQLNEEGAFGDWPEDFADVRLEAQSRYLDAADARLANQQ